MSNQHCRRWTRRLTCFALATAAAASLVAEPTVAAANRNTRREVSYAGLPSGAVDAQVFMAPNATKEQIATVRAAIRATNTVERFTLLDHEAARREVARILSGEPNLVRGASRAHIPVTFRVDFADDAHLNRWIARMAKLPGVRHVTNTQGEGTDDVLDNVAACVSKNSTTELFMTPDATSEQIEAVRQALTQQPGTTEVTVVSKEDAYAEFAKVFADNEELVSSIRPADLSVSFRFTIDPKTEPSVTMDSLRSLPGVDAVLDLARMCRAFGIELPAG